MVGRGSQRAAVQGGAKGARVQPGFLRSGQTRLWPALLPQPPKQPQEFSSQSIWLDAIQLRAGAPPTLSLPAKVPGKAHPTPVRAAPLWPQEGAQTPRGKGGAGQEEQLTAHRCPRLSDTARPSGLEPGLCTWLQTQDGGPAPHSPPPMQSPGQRGGLGRRSPQAHRTSALHAPEGLPNLAPNTPTCPLPRCGAGRNAPSEDTLP